MQHKQHAYVSARCGAVRCVVANFPKRKNVQFLLYDIAVRCVRVVLRALAASDVRMRVRPRRSHMQRVRFI